MLELKYKDREYLKEYNLDIELFNRFNVKVNDIIPFRNVYLLNTASGRKILKKLDMSIEDINYISSGVDYIRESFPRVMQFTKSRDGRTYTIFDNDVYCMIDLIEGRECEFSNVLDINIAAEGLGELHKAAEGFRCSIPSKNIFGKEVEILKRKFEEMQFFKKLVLKYEFKNEFDDIFLKNVDYYLEKISDSIKLIEGSQYYKLCSEEDKITLCHHDLAHHNIIIKDSQAYFIDFDYAVIDLKVHDLCNFIVKVIKNFAFDIEKARMIISGYCKFNTLDIREIQVLYGMLNFPEDFYSITRDYYTRRKKWDEEVFLYKLKKKVEYKEYNEEFLQKFSAMKF